MKNVVIGILIGGCFMLAAAVRYQVGRPISSGVYTEQFDASDGIYKFIQTDFGEPNAPKLQAAPDEWIKQFGNNERTMLMYEISELRVISANVNKRISALEAGPGKTTKGKIENGKKNQ
jgi:hypothetical protein